MSASASGQNIGKIKQVIGPIVDVEFDSGRLPAIFHAVKLTNATISEVTRFEGDLAPNDGAATWRLSSATGTSPGEQWSFTFQKIEVDDKDGKTTYVDDWAVTSEHELSRSIL